MRELIYRRRKRNLPRDYTKAVSLRDDDLGDDNRLKMKYNELRKSVK